MLLSAASPTADGGWASVANPPLMRVALTECDSQWIAHWSRFTTLGIDDSRGFRP
ncbi:hypothetical protein EV279_0642 [Microbacterium sp. BK668]|nr:hypothetical protein EV279_0642 [Microbacterium sp. BK668]